MGIRVLTLEVTAGIAGDELGLDVVVEKLEALQSSFGDRFRPADVLVQKVRAGHLGKKTRRGFMEWA